MTVLSKVISTATDRMGRIIVKILRFGRDDVQTAVQVSPFGDDSNPTKDMVAVYAPTSEMGKQVIIGYLNVKSLAEVGGKRLFSTDANGNKKAVIYLRSGGDIEINGDKDNMVRFSELEKSFNQLRDDFNKVVTAFNVHVHASAAPGPPVPPTPVPNSVPAIPSTATVAAAKIDNVKTN